MIYNVVFISGIQQSESVIHIYIFTLLRFFSHIGHYRVLSRVPCAVGNLLVPTLEKAMAPHSSTLAWKIPWTGSLVGCSPWGR